MADPTACYYPNGDPADHDVPCSPTQPGGMTGCCAPGWECLSSGLCHASDTSLNEIGRGSCTDQYWQSSYCPNVCLDPTKNVLDGGSTLLRCNNGSYYCADYSQNAVNDPACGKSEEVHNYSSMSAFTTISPISTFVSIVTLNGASAQTTFLSSITPSSFSAPSSMIAASATGNIPTESGGVNGSSSASANGHGGGTNVGAAVGGGIGGGLALILFGCLAVFWWKRHKNNRKKRRSLQKEVYEPNHGDHLPEDTYDTPLAKPYASPMELPTESRVELPVRPHAAELADNEKVSSRYTYT